MNPQINEPTQARVDYRLPVLLLGDDAASESFVEQTFAENVTRRGAFVLTARSLEPGSLLAVHDADDVDRRLCYVQVVWRRAGDGASGVGVRIVNDNGAWMDYLVARSVEALAEEPDDTD